MSKKPCQELIDQLIKAGKEWTTATETTMKYVITEITDENEVPVLSKRDVEEMIVSYEEERKAKDKYFLIARQLLNCQNKYE